MPRSKKNKKLLSLQEASEILGVLPEVLINWNEHQILKATITESGEIGYSKEQLSKFQTITSSPQEEVAISPSQPATSVKLPEAEIASPSSIVSAFSLKTLIGRILHWIGIGFYEDEFIKEYLKSQVKESLSLQFRMPSKNVALVLISIATVLLTAGLTQQNRIRFLVNEFQNNSKDAQAVRKAQEVLAANASKIKLTGNIIFTLPVNSKQDTTIDKNLRVGGQSVFVGNITAPNVIYSITAGDNIILSGDEQSPTISADLSQTISTFQGQTGDITLEEGSDISIDGLEISNTSTLTTVVARGTCSTCITDSAVANNLTIEEGGSVSGTAIKNGLVGTTVGGTGLTTYTTGDILYASDSDTLAGLPIGTTNGQILQVNNGVPAWTSIALNATGTNSTTSGATLIGVFDEFASANGTTVQEVLNELDAAITSAGVTPFTIDTDGTYGDFITPTSQTYDFALGGTTIANSSLHFDESAATLFLGTNNTGSGGQNATLTLYSAGNGVTDTSLTTDNSGNLLISTSGNVGIGTGTPTAADFKVEVAGHIGPSVDATYDLSSPTRRFRNIYLSGTTTSDGDITIANVDPSLRFEDTTASQDDFAINVNNSTLTLQNETQARNELVISSAGDFDIAGGASSTGCTITNASGNLACSGSGSFVGVNANAGLLQGTGGLTITGATNINTSGSNATNIGTGSNTGTITIGNASGGDLVLVDPNWNISGAGAANFASVGATTPGTGAFTTFSATGNTSINTSGSNATSIGTGTNTGTINIGNTSGGDLVLSDPDWNISGAGAANFISIGATTPGTGAFTTLTSNGNTTLGDAAADTITLSGTVQGATPFTFEGASDDTIETIFAITDPTLSDKTITFPNASGTVAV